MRWPSCARPRTRPCAEGRAAGRLTRHTHPTRGASAPPGSWCAPSFRGVTTLMKIVDVVQRSPDWQGWRAQGVTASEAAVVLGRSPYKTPWRLWAERTGLRPSAGPVRQPPRAARHRAGGCRPAGLRGALRHPAAPPGAGSPTSTPFCGLPSTASPTTAPRWSSRSRRRPPSQTSRHDRPRRPPSGSTGRRSNTSSTWPLPWLARVDGGPQRLLGFPVERDEAFLSEELVPACLQFWDAVAERKEPPRDPARDL